MRMYDIIAKKRNGGALSDEEIGFFIKGFVGGEIPDYQASALLMAIYFQGMNEHETAVLTKCMAQSGETVDLSSIPGIKVDKHSTGGVGDKTTLIVAPVVAACGVPVAKMSGRGLGFTGGTVDKLASIPGFQTDIPREEFFSIVRKVGCSLIGQSGNMVPADKKLYALRDVTATVESIPLIASSIMSKKLAAGSDCILLDVKTGSGAFMKTTEQSIALAREMVAIGENNGRGTIALITDMDRPLGSAIGNTLEVIEAVETLQNRGPSDLVELCLHLAANMLVLAKKGPLTDCLALARQALQSGAAFRKFKEMVSAQGGDASYLENPEKFGKAAVSVDIKAETDGVLSSMNTEQCGIASVLLGAGRETKDSQIDYSAGILLHKKVGDTVRAGDTLATLFAATEDKCLEAGQVFRQAVVIGASKPKELPLIQARITKDGIERTGE